MKKTLLLGISVSILGISVLAGCGNTTSNSANNTVTNTANTANTGTTVTKNSSGGKTIIEGASGYTGKANLNKYQSAAKSSPKSVTAQMNAGVASHVNGNDTAAIAYYKKAIALQPSNGEAYNDIGNIYLRDKNDAKAALPYYQKATTVEPSYSYGWWNLAITQATLKDTQGELQTLTKALTVVKTSDPVYKELKAMKSQMTSTK